MNILAIISVLLAAASFALSVTQATLKQFVEVFIVEQVKPLKLSCAIAGLAVYETSYDSSCLSPETLAASRVPSEKFTAPTTEFKLLFPAQQNFVAEVLPINVELAEQLRPVFTDEGADAIIALVSEINDLTFESCEQYMADAQVALTTLFVTFNDGLLPQVAPLLGAEVVAGVAEGLFALEAALNATDATNALVQFLGGSFEFVRAGVEATCNGGNPVSILPSPDGTLLSMACVAAIYNGAGNTVTTNGFPLTGGMLSAIGGDFSFCSANISPTLTVLDCLLGTLKFVALDTGLLATQAFSGGASSDFCTLFTDIGCDASTRASFIGFLFALFSDAAQVAAAFGQAAVAEQLAEGAAGFGLVSAVVSIFQPELFAAFPATTEQTIDALLDLDPSFPSAFSDRYPPCGLLMVAELGGLPLPSIPDFDFPNVTECSFSVYFAGATELATAAANPLAEILAQITFLYQVCELFGATPDTCGLFFPALFINGAYGGDMDAELANFAVTGINGVFEGGVRECNFDEEDLDAVSKAQIVMGLAMGVYFLCFASTIAALFVPKGKGIVMILAAALSGGAVACNLAALLLVRSAPVYDSVGEPPVLDAAYYQEGLVATLALVTLVIAALVIACELGAAYLEMKKGKSLEELEVKDEVKDLQVAAKV